MTNKKDNDSIIGQILNATFDLSFQLIRVTGHGIKSGARYIKKEGTYLLASKSGKLNILQDRLEDIKQTIGNLHIELDSKKRDVVIRYKNYQGLNKQNKILREQKAIEKNQLAEIVTYESKKRSVEKCIAELSPVAKKSQTQSVPVVSKKIDTPTIVSSQAKEIEAKKIEQLVEQDLAAIKEQAPLTFEQQVEKHYKLETFISDVKETVLLYKSQSAEQRTAMELSYQNQLGDPSISEGLKLYLKTVIEEIQQIKTDLIISRSMNQKKKPQKKRKP